MSDDSEIIFFSKKSTHKKYFIPVQISLSEDYGVAQSDSR